MIRSFYIDNFKSLVNFRLPPAPHALGPFVCLVGLNGAGKSTVLQALDFVAHVAQGKVQQWLDQRDWKKGDLTSRFLSRQLIRFRLEFEFSSASELASTGKEWELGPVVWEGSFNPSLMRCTSETVSIGDRVLLRSADQMMTVQPLSNPHGKSASIEVFNLKTLKFEGSALSLLKAGSSAFGIWALMDALAEFRSLDMLSPQSMRRRAKDADDLGTGGERLSAYLHNLPREARERLIGGLQTFYPHLHGYTTQSLRSGWKDLRIEESFRDAQGRPIQTTARHVNDGLLRVLAILSQVDLARRGTVLERAGMLSGSRAGTTVFFDEIENGINPELVEKLVNHLLHAGPQVFVTTHSPLILNYLPDDVARQAVMLLYRNEQGHTQAARLFDLPSMQDKLGLLGPGEAYVDTDLNALPLEAQRLAQQPSEASA